MQLNKSLLQNNASLIQHINHQHSYSVGGGIPAQNNPNILIQGNVVQTNAHLSNVLLGNQQIPIYGSCRLPSAVASNLVNNNEGQNVLDPNAKSIAAVHI